jgi:hypothetical protein
MKNAIRPGSPWNQSGRIYPNVFNLMFGNIAPCTGYDFSTTGVIADLAKELNKTQVKDGAFLSRRMSL